MNFRTSCLVVALLAASFAASAQPTPQQNTAQTAPTFAQALNAFEKLRAQRMSVQTRVASQREGAKESEVVTRTRDWEIDSHHMIAKSKQLHSMKGAARVKVEREIVEHALRLLADDARLGNEDRELETFTAVSNVLAALVHDSQSVAQQRAK